ncbi:MAG: ATP-dependent Clp protease adaptor ClpS [Planctomycetes bacterium]|nr:ATP-dependent Clp protease adaptor ClpS [Planctomycetota bacterium]
MELALTHDSEPVSKQADALFEDWLNELPEGALRDRVHHLSRNFRNLPPTQNKVGVGSVSSEHVLLTGQWLVDGRCEIIGPYVRHDMRKRGIGTWGVKLACLMACASRNLHILTPAPDVWMIDHLENLEFRPISPYVRDGAGDHRASYADQVQLARGFHSSVREPRGRGSWALVLLNDDDTSFEVVTRTLQLVLDVDAEIAWNYAVLVHHEGSALLRRCLTQRGANALARRIERFASMSEAPLRAIVERR